MVGMAVAKGRTVLAVGINGRCDPRSLRCNPDLSTSSLRSRLRHVRWFLYRIISSLGLGLGREQTGPVGFDRWRREFDWGRYYYVLAPIVGALPAWYCDRCPVKINVMDACCEQKTAEINILRGEHRKVLVVVLVVNAALFVVEAGAGLLAHSTTLLADSLDMLGDSLVYGFSLYVLWRSAEWKAMAAVLKGIVMAVFGVGVLVEAPYKMTVAVVPAAETMGIIGLLALLGNGFCFLLLYRHRSDDLNRISRTRSGSSRGVSIRNRQSGFSSLHSVLLRFWGTRAHEQCS